MIVQFLILLAIPLAEKFAADMRRLRHSDDRWRASLDRRLRELVNFAYQRSAFYRQAWDAAGVSPADVRGVDDLRKLPIIERDVWRTAPQQDLLPQDLRGKRLWRQTSGTSGEPLYVPNTLPDEYLFRATMMATARDNGAKWTDRVLVLLPSRSPHPGGRRLLGREVLIRPQATPEEQLAAVLKGGYRQLRSSPWVLWRVVVLARRQGLSLPAVPLVFTGDEVLTHAVRRTIEQALATRIANHYGATDSGYMAEDCRFGRLHVLPRSAHIEIVRDNHPAQPGEEGEVVVTNFLSHAQPIVRVRTHDWAAWDEEPCPCGSPLPHLAYVAGRLSDKIVTPAGRAITWPAVEDALSAQGDNLLGVQVEQVDAGKVIARLSLVSAPDTLADSQHALQTLFDGLSVEVILTDDFRTEPNGKVRPVIGYTP